MKQGPNKAPDGDALFPKPINQPDSVAEKTPPPGDLGDSGIEPDSKRRPIGPGPHSFHKGYPVGGRCSPTIPPSASGLGVASTVSTQPGQILFDRYLVQRQLGKGGMGTVWLVRHLGFDSDRALKLIISGIAQDQQMQARFKREARIMDRLNHPNVVRVYDTQLVQNTAFIEMEYIPGQSVDQLLKLHPGVPMPLDWVTDLLDQLCNVLQAAKDEGIIHRDLKPSNLMVVEGRTPGTKILKLLDFGIAKIREGADDFHTKTGAYLGTPYFSSPEQFGGEVLDSRSDLYSVGVILYELLTGHRPFTGPIHAMIYHHAMTPPPPFASRNADLAIPPGVEQVVMRCLAKDRNDRPQSPRELAEMFHQALWGADTVVPPTPSGPSTIQIMPGTTLRSGSAVESSPRPPAQPASPPGPSSPADSEVEGDLPLPRDRTHPDALRRLTFWLWLALSAIALLPAILIASLLPEGCEALQILEEQIASWNRQGYKVDPAGGTTGGGWPKTLLSEAEDLRFHWTPGGIYLPDGFSPGEETDPFDGFPRTLVREDGQTFLRIAGGTFTMGCLDEGLVADDDPTRPAHPVKLSGCYMQKTEVTNGEIERYLKDIGPGVCPEWERRFDNLKMILGEEVARKHPAVGIPWPIASSYARKRGGRLPTEAQWEFAARSRGQFFHHAWDHRGERAEPLAQLANINSLGANESGTASVGSYPMDVTVQGVLDLTGNVREWCRDVWRRYERHSGPEVDPQSGAAPGEQVGVKQILRGGSFLSAPEFGQTTNRDEPHEPGEAASDVGFRIIIECPEGPLATAR